MTTPRFTPAEMRAMADSCDLDAAYYERRAMREGAQPPIESSNRKRAAMLRQAASTQEELDTLKGKVKELRVDLTLGATQQESNLYRQGCAAMARSVLSRMTELGLIASPETPQEKTETAAANLGLLFHAAEHFRDEEANATDDINAGHFAGLVQAVEWARKQLAETPQEQS